MKALQVDGIPPDLEGKVDEADKLLSEAASEALSVKVGAIRPEDALSQLHANHPHKLVALHKFAPPSLGQSLLRQDLNSPK